MKTFTIQIPKELQGKPNQPPRVAFEMSRRHYWINDTQYDHDLYRDNIHGFSHYDYTILNKSVVVTLFEPKNIL